MTRPRNDSEQEPFSAQNASEQERFSARNASEQECLMRPGVVGHRMIGDHRGSLVGK
jgi:hypothetical protein